MNLKRRSVFFKLVFVLLTLVLVLAGCSQSSSTSEQGTGEQKPELDSIIITSGPQGGTFYSVMAAMCEHLPRDIEGLTVTGIEGAAQENLRTVNRGETHLGTFWSNEFIDAIRGQGTFENEKLEKLRAVCRLSTGMQYILVRADSDIYTIDDLAKAKGLKFSPGEVGSGLESSFRAIFNGAGYSYEDILNNGGEIIYEQYGRFAEMMGDGHLDAFFLGAPYNSPHKSALQIETSIPLRVIPIEGPWVETLCEEIPSFQPGTLKAGVYKGQDQPVPVIEYYTMVGTNIDVPEDLVYEIAKSIYNNIDKWIELAPQLEEFFSGGPEEFAKGFPADSLHPGAAKFWKEVGAIE
ncbi:MAG: TAXI family TRAP transporter solute-binding subunit [Clostridia bacterium]|nr:TAXI family TRAP transporter solute-binding subunit [Clostridiales bacterium]